jgi:peptidoglycan-N-acetylglucosamine deacetylase
MNLYPHKLPDIFTTLFPSFVWKLSAETNNQIYLTFDDGPHPEITPWVMDQLESYGFKGTFFCVGENVKKYPEVYQSILARGHRTGNHTQNHLKGWKTENERYLENIVECSQYVDSDLFRPPYGQISPAQTAAIKNDYKIIMWNILSGDFYPDLNLEFALNKLKRVSKAGDIVIFHDSQKAWDRLRFILPPYLNYLKEKGFTGASL